MKIKFANQEHTLINVFNDDGSIQTVPADQGSGHYREVLKLTQGWTEETHELTTPAWVETLADGSTVSHPDVYTLTLTTHPATTTLEPFYTSVEELAALKVAKSAEVRAKFEIDSNADVLVGAVTYQGGFDSAIKLDAAKRLAEAAGFTSVVFYDATNKPQMLTLANAQNVVIAVSSAFQTHLAAKQTKLVAIADATTVAQVNAVVI